MTTQPEALRHADKLDAHEFDEPHGAAAELRRLYMVDKLYQAALAGRNVMHLELHKANAERGTLQAQRDALLAVVNKLEYSSDGYIKRYPEESEVSAAIKQAEENT